MREIVLLKLLIWLSLVVGIYATSAEGDDYQFKNITMLSA